MSHLVSFSDHDLVGVTVKHKWHYTKGMREGHNRPWLTNEITSRMNERDYWFRKARRTANENDWSTYRRL